MNLPRLEPVEYRGELVALVSAERVHIVAPWLLDRPVGDPELRFVAFMCAYCASELGEDREVDRRTAEAWARRALIDVDAIHHHHDLGEVALRMRVPEDQLLAALDAERSTRGARRAPGINGT